MDKRFENKMTMLKAVLSLLLLKATEWSISAPLVAAIAELENLVYQIEQIQQITEEDNSGLTEAKNLQKEALVKKVFELASILLAMATKTKDQVLQTKVDFPISVLRSMRNSELAQSSKNVLDLGRANLQALIEYGTSEVKLSAIDEQINVYKNSLPAPRVSVSERKAANTKLKELLKQAMQLVSKQIDRMMVSFEADKPEFYAAYMNARKVRGYGTRYQKAEVPEPVAQP